MELCDVTLREGDQMPGRSYSVDQKVAAGRELDRLGLAYLQAGFPITGEKDRAVTRRLSSSADAQVVGLARSLPGDVDAALDAGSDVVEVMAGFSDYQLDHVLRTTAPEMLDALRGAVDRADDGGSTVHVSLVDAFRTDRELVVEVIDRVTDVDVVNLADSVGSQSPGEVRAYLDALSGDVDMERLGVHFHDDLGVATANALAAVDAGVTRVDASVAALGERAGNPALEELVVGATLRDGSAPVDDPGELIPVCRSVLDILGESIPPRKAVIGEEVSTHESGIHTAAMLEDPETFEPYDPERFGGRRRLVFGGQSGRSAATKLVQEAGVEPSDWAVDRALDLLAAHGPLSRDEAVTLIESELGR